MKCVYEQVKPFSPLSQWITLKACNHSNIYVVEIKVATSGATVSKTPPEQPDNQSCVLYGYQHIVILNNLV